MTHEFGGNTLDIGQFLALIPMFEYRWRLTCHVNFGGARGAKTGLDQGRHFTVLHHAPEQLADRLAFAQHFDLIAGSYIRRYRADKGDGQRAQRSVRRHLGAQRLVLQGSDQPAKGGPALGPFGRDGDIQRIATGSVEQITKAHGDLTSRKSWRNLNHRIAQAQRPFRPKTGPV